MLFEKKKNSSSLIPFDSISTEIESIPSATKNTFLYNSTVRSSPGYYTKTFEESITNTGVVFLITNVGSSICYVSSPENPYIIQPPSDTTYTVYITKVSTTTMEYKVTTPNALMGFKMAWGAFKR